MTERIISDLIESNVFIYSDQNSCIIVDAAAELEKIKPVVGNKKVVGIFLTHAHYDHCFYALDYAKEFGCKIYCSKQATEYLSNPDYNYSERKFKVEQFSEFVFIDEPSIIKLENIKISCVPLGGHSKADMCFVAGDEVFVGDVLIGRDIGRLDLYGGDKSQMIKSLEYLKSLDYSIMHSGHGNDTTKIQQDKVINLWLKFLNR